MPLFSVIIPTFNRIALLTRTVEGVLQQRFRDFETIVVDDGSMDGTTSYLQSLLRGIRVFHQANNGPARARNLGAFHAEGRYLAFLDSDDLWFPWTLEVYLEVIQKHHGPSFIAGKPYLFSDEHELQKAVRDAARTERYVDYLASGDQWRWWGASSFVIRRDVFVAAGGFIDKRMNGEDGDLALRLGVAPGFVQITAPVTFAYRQHPGSAMKNLKQTCAGAWSMIRAEQAGHYPGGMARAAERRRILMRHTRPVTLECLRHGLQREAWMLYRKTFAWNASLGRLRYLAAFPLVAVGCSALWHRQL
jgi:GT2 family glycosyltransferase